MSCNANESCITLDQTQWIKKNSGSASEEKERDLSYIHKCQKREIWVAKPPLVPFPVTERKEKQRDERQVMSAGERLAVGKAMRAAKWWAAVDKFKFPKSIIYYICCCFFHIN